jgi:F-type H+-transporting ATPase subunit epsilon
MPPLFDLRAMARERTVYSGRVSSVVAPGREGYFGVLAHHADMVAELGVGRAEVVEEAGQVRWFALSGGFLSVGGHQVTMLADAMEAAEEVDVARAQAAAQRAEERLSLGREEVDVVRAQAALERALNRLRVAEARRE